MTTDVVKVQGNYIVKAQGGSITLNSPTTVITGDLNVLGDTTTIQSENASIKDNVIILNSGETNPYVTLGTAGILIARGFADSPSNAASLIYDDTLTFTINGDSYKGAWNFGSTLNNNGHVINVSAITIPATINTLTFFSTVNPNAVLSVRGTTNYENNVIDPDDIPNKAYVDSLSASTEFAKKLLVGNTYIEISDDSVLITDPYYGSPNTIRMNLGVPGTDALVLQGTQAIFNSLSLVGRSIQVTNTATGVDMILTPGQDGLIKTGGGLKIQKTVAIPAESGFTAIYSTSTVGGGGTGIHYVNSGDTDELVSRRRSIVYSIIF